MREKLAQAFMLWRGVRRERGIILFGRLLIGISWYRVHEELVGHHYFGLPQLTLVWSRERRFYTPAQTKEMFG